MPLSSSNFLRCQIGVNVGPALFSMHTQENTHAYTHTHKHTYTLAATSQISQSFFLGRANVCTCARVCVCVHSKSKQQGSRIDSIPQRLPVTLYTKLRKKEPPAQNTLFPTKKYLHSRHTHMHSGANEITASCCDISRKVLWKEKANIGNRKTFVQEFTEVFFFFSFHRP